MEDKIKNWEEIKKDIDYLFSKINWGESFLDAKAIAIMNEFVIDIEKFWKDKIKQ